MSTYLLDYENVSHYGFAGYAQLTSEDTVVVFVGAKNGSAGVPVDTVRQLTARGNAPRLLWKRAKKSAPNYLDFQLVSYLGYLIGDPEIDEQEFVVVSKDQGFLACVDFWAERRREVKISVRPTITPESPVTVPEKAADVPMTNPPKTAGPVSGSGTVLAGPGTAISQHTVNESTKKAVRAAVKSLGLKPSHYTVIYSALSGSASPQEFHTRLQRGAPEHGSEIYRQVKDIYENLT